VYRALRQIGHDAIAMEDYVAADQRPADKCLRDVATCDLYIGIFAWRYGYVPPQDNPEARSITELEFREARSCAIHCLLFLLDEEAEWPPSHIESGEGNRRMHSLRDELCAGFTISFFRGPDDLAAQVSASVAKWERDSPPCSLDVLQKLLEVLAIRRAFFKGDELLQQDAMAVAQAGEHLWNVRSYLDAGRAVIVARSFAEAADELRQTLSGLAGSLHRRIGQEVVSLIVACKDYAERYGRHRSECNLPLPHIGLNQRLADFTTTTGARFCISSQDSIEVYQQLLRYFVQSCSDLIEVRNHAQRLVNLIAKTEPSLGSSVEQGTRQLQAMREMLEQTATVIGEVLANTAGFDELRETLCQRASSEVPDVSRLLLAVAKVRHSTAWSVPSPTTTLIAANFLHGYRMRVLFADGLTGDVELGEEFWKQHDGISMDLGAFRLFQLDKESNAIAWSNHHFLTGESVRFLVDTQKPSSIQNSRSDCRQ
jgi:hypothetical protein